MGRTYIGAILAGEDPGDIDDWVGRWHESDTGLSLPQFLGMTEEEYHNWVLAPGALEHIVAIRRMVEESRIGITGQVAKLSDRVN